MEDDFKILIDRKEPAQHVKNNYSAQLNLLKEEANYGARLIVRSFDRSKKTITDTVIITVLLKQLVAMIDAIQILLEQANIYAAYLPLRTLCETELYIQWILLKDTDVRTKQYYVYYLMERKKYNESVLKGKFSSFLSITEEKMKEIVEQNNEIEQILNSSFAEIYNAFNQEKKKIRKWYNPSGINSVRDIAKELNQEVEYEVIYSFLSKATHSQNIDSIVRLEKKGISLPNIRDIKDIAFVISMTSSLSIRAYMGVIDKFLPSEKTDFCKKYVNEWSSRSINIPQIDVQYI